MNRRQFLGRTLALAGAATLAPTTLLADIAKPSMALRLTLFHTNDTHSWLEPFNTGQFSGLGGVAARATLLRKLRAEHPNSLLLDGGDILQGTPYFNLFMGQPEIEAMNRLGYDAAAIGNHEFDAGVERLAELVGGVAEFPFLCANYDFSDTPMAGLAKESMVIEKQGLRIGLTGAGINLRGLVLPRMYGETRYLNPLEEVSRVAKHLRNEEGCDFVICLSHINLMSRMGEPGDRDLIREIPEVDVVIGGHNHILMPEPEVTFRGRGQSMGVVAQAGWAGTHLGVIQFDLFGRNEVSFVSGGVLDAAIA